MMSNDTLSFIMALFCVVAIVAAIYIANKFPNCEGECEQGRKPCDCRDNNENIKPPKDSVQGG